MRRALLAAGQLLRRGTRAQAVCGESITATVPALAAAAAGLAGGGNGGGLMGGGLPWALHPQAPLLSQAPAAALQQAVHGSRSASSTHNDGSSTRSTDGSSAAATRKKRGRPLSPVPDVDAAQLLCSLGLHGAADPAALLTNLRKLPGVRQQGVLDSAAAVAAHLRSPAVGLAAQQAGQLLEHCPALFSWPPEQRAAVLFGELLGAGVAEPVAAACFMAYPEAAERTYLKPGLAELAAILAHSEDKQGGRGRPSAVPAAQRTVAALLAQTPSAVQLVCQRAGYLQQRAAELQQAGFSAAQVAALAWQRPEMLLTHAAAKVARAAAVVQQELGLPTANVARKATLTTASWVLASEETVRARAAALAQGFGQAPAAAMLASSAVVLGVAPATWRRNLCYMAACGVADPKAVLQQHSKLLAVDHAAAVFLQRRLLLQRCFRLTAAQLYEQHSHRLRHLEPQQLAQRLQFVEHCGQVHRLVAKSEAGVKLAAASAEERQRALSMVTVTTGRFLPALGASQAEWEAWVAANPPEACPLYRWAQQAAAEEAARLAAALPAELAQRERRPNPFRARSKAAA